MISFALKKKKKDLSGLGWEMAQLAKCFVLCKHKDLSYNLRTSMKGCIQW